MLELLARSGDVDLLVLPELFLGGYELADVQAIAIELDGAEIEAVRGAAAAAGTAVVLGAAERTGAGVANSAICVDGSGDLAGVYRKAHPFGAERDAYLAGDELVTVRLGGRTVGLMICFDMEFPEVARTLALRGADLLVTISANSPPFELDHDVFARARALENGLPHVYVNRVGEQDGLSFCGGSLALDPEGRAVAEVGPDVERVVTVAVGASRRRDPRTRYLELLRAPLYAEPARIEPDGDS